jgi:hypothetical protein
MVDGGIRNAEWEWPMAPGATGIFSSRTSACLIQEIILFGISFIGSAGGPVDARYFLWRPLHFSVMTRDSRHLLQVCGVRHGTDGGRSDAPRAHPPYRIPPTEPYRREVVSL